MTNIIHSFLWRRKFALILVTVITVNVYTTHGQSYLLALGQNSRSNFERELLDPFGTNYTTSLIKHTLTSSDYSDDFKEDDKNTTIFVIKNSLHSKSSELSQTAMDVITIVWYVATFLALAAFFLLMACSDRRCNARQRAAAAAARDNETPNPPPTPSPSYSQFAPPSYESVMNLENLPSIYVIPFPLESLKEDNNNQIDGNLENQTNQQLTPAVTFYTINELQKLGS